jgi:hypothetical protein
MKRPAVMVLCLLVSLFATGCAPIYTGAMAAGGPLRPRAIATRPYEPPPIGRWDALMSLAKASTITVLTTDGITRIAVFAGATVDSLIVVGSASNVAIPRLEVVRVDLVGTSGRGQLLVREAAAGGLVGALTAGVGLALIPFLASGEVWVPPARVWGVGALLGAAGAMTNPKEDRRPRTIYIAPLDTF